MVISYYGITCFKLQAGETVLAIDPYGKNSGLTPPRFEAHAVLLSGKKSSQDFSITGDPLVCASPGEFETKDIVITGLDTPEGTAFYIEWEGLRMLHLGTIKNVSSVESILEHIDTIDILFAPADGSSSDMQKIISSIDPRIIIPMQGEGKKGAIDTLVKEIGEKPEKLDKLTIKKKGLPAEGQRLIVLDSPQ
ncbi:MAG: MBL fold metallo-hydrolase [Patescibacteria group bacterium]